MLPQVLMGKGTVICHNPGELQSHGRRQMNPLGAPAAGFGAAVISCLPESLCEEGR